MGVRTGNIDLGKESRWTDLACRSEESWSDAPPLSDRPVAFVVEQRRPHRIQLERTPGLVREDGLLEERVHIDPRPRRSRHDDGQPEHLLQGAGRQDRQNKRSASDHLTRDLIERTFAAA